MNSSDINFTPLKNPKKQGGISFFFSNIIAFSTAGMVVLSLFIFKQLNSPITNTSKASEIATYDCHNDPENIKYPESIKAVIDANSKQEKEISLKATVDTKNITFSWKENPKAKGYYVMLTDNPNAKKGWLDPFKEGKLATQSSYTFTNLESNKTYYFLSRSWSKKGRLSMNFPTPSDCRYALSAPPLFLFSTK